MTLRRIEIFTEGFGDETYQWQGPWCAFGWEDELLTEEGNKSYFDQRQIVGHEIDPISAFPVNYRCFFTEEGWNRAGQYLWAALENAIRHEYRKFIRLITVEDDEVIIEKSDTMQACVRVFNGKHFKLAEVA